MNLKRRLKNGLGRVLSTLLERRTADVQRRFTIPSLGPGSAHGLIDRLIRAHLANRLKADDEALEDTHRDFWRGQPPDGWYRDAERKVTEVYAPSYGPFVDRLADRVAAHPVDRFVELGAGDGSWLDYLSHRIEGAGRFVGVDISELEITRNRARYPSLEFVHDDIVGWARANASPRTVYHTNSGVLEYLSERSLRQLLAILAARAKDSLLLFIEPLAPDHDLRTEPHSKPWGDELSYSHNYPHWFEVLGLQTIECEERQVMGYRMMMIMGRTDGVPAAG